MKGGGGSWGGNIDWQSTGQKDLNLEGIRKGGGGKGGEVLRLIGGREGGLSGLVENCPFPLGGKTRKKDLQEMKEKEKTARL